MHRPHVGSRRRAVSGKSTVDPGIVRFDRFRLRRSSVPSAPREISELSRRLCCSAPHRKRLQNHFQDPTLVNPRITIGESSPRSRSITACRASRGTEQARELLETRRHARGTKRQALSAFFNSSGGQRPRICIAARCALDPDVLVAEEASPRSR